MGASLPVQLVECSRACIVEAGKNLIGQNISFGGWKSFIASDGPSAALFQVCICRCLTGPFCGEIAKAGISLARAIRLPSVLTFNAILRFQNLTPRGVWFASIEPAENLLRCLQAGKLSPHQPLFRLMPSHGARLFAKLGFCCCHSGKKQRRERAVWKWQLNVVCQLALSLSLSHSVALFLRVSCRSLFFPVPNDSNKWISESELFKTDQHQSRT